MRIRLIGFIVFFSMLVSTAVACFAETRVTSSVMPVPPSLLDLPAIDVEPWTRIDPKPFVFIEGPAFDRQGNLYIVSVFDSRILKITPDKKVTTIFSKKGLLPSGLAFHKNGRLFVVCGSGQILSMNHDGSEPTTHAVRIEGKPMMPNDLVFDQKGNFFVTDWSGTLPEPTGGVYRFSSDFMNVIPVIQGLASPNGIGLDPGRKALWVGEMGRNSLVRLELAKDGVSLAAIKPVSYTYRFSGYPGPDGMAVDSKGHVYQAMSEQGRVVVFREGIPVAQVLIPGRDEGKHLRLTNLAFKPGTSDVYITLSGMGGAWIYKFRGLSEGLKLFSHE